MRCATLILLRGRFQCLQFVIGEQVCRTVIQQIDGELRASVAIIGIHAAVLPGINVDEESAGNGESRRPWNGPRHRGKEPPSSHRREGSLDRDQ